MGAVGMFYLSFMRAGSSYLTARACPPMIITSLGLGLVFVSVASTALFNVAPDDTGAASAVLSTAQQIGGSFGTAIQNTIFVSSATALGAALALKARHGGLHVANVARYIHNTSWVHGYDMAFRFGASVLVLAAVVFYLMVNVDRHHLAQHDQVPSA